MAPTAKPVFGPNDFNMAMGTLQPGLGDDEERMIREARSGGYLVLDEPPAKAELRRQADELKAKAKQLSLVERELEAERTKSEQTFAERMAALDEREALLNAQLKALEK